MFSKSNNNAINIITSIATIGVIVSTIALFVVLSVFSGLKTFSLSFIQTSDPDLKISSVKGKSFLFNDPLQKSIASDKIKAYTKVIEERAFFNYKDKSHIAVIKGVDSNYLKVNRMDTAIYFGEWINHGAKYATVVGSGISNILSVGTYDYIDALKIFVPKPGEGFITSTKTTFNQVNTQPIGIYRLTNELDKKYVFGTLELVQELLDYEDNQISAIELKLTNSKNVKEVVEQLVILVIMIFWAPIHIAKIFLMIRRFRF